MPPKQLKYASRYKREDEDEGDNDQIILQQATAGPPAICMVFKLPDEDDTLEEDLTRLKADREKIIGRLRALGFNIDQMCNQAGDKIFLKISLSREALYRQAIERKIKVRLEKGSPGTAIPFDETLNQKKVFREPDDGNETFSSLQQLEMADFVLRSEPFSDGTEEVERLVPEKMLEDPVDGVEGSTRILGYYFLHEPELGFRGKLIQQWPLSYTSPQPLHLVQAYYGEKIALYFTWLGYYISMLWIPAISGTILAATQESENPYTLMFCIGLVAWGVLFTHLWKRLELKIAYEYDTLDFEESEELRLEFMQHESTVVNGHINSVNGQTEAYWMDEGTWLPPTGRAACILQSYAVVATFCVLAIVVDVFIYNVVALPLMMAGNETLGGIACGVCFALASVTLQRLFGTFFEHMIHAENWPTETTHEDACILRACPFHIVCCYFGPFMILALAENIDMPGVSLRCPDGQCLGTLRTVVATQFVALLLIRQFVERVIPAAQGAYRAYVTDAALKKKVKKKLIRFPMEEELDYDDFEGVSEAYAEFVYQFGWVALFGAAFPWVSLLALGSSVVELRGDALKLLRQTKRPRYMCAKDIGSWQVVLEAIVTLSVLTNAVFVGLTSHTLYFYYPEMTAVERLWAVAILEHALYLMKVLIEMFLPTDNAEEEEERERQQYKVQESMKGWFGK